MKEKIERFAEGKFEFESPELQVSDETIEIELEAGTVYHGSFTINNTRQTTVRGVVYASDRRIRIANPKFKGEKERIYYEIHADYIEPGDVLLSDISIVSDCGEYNISVKARAMYPALVSPNGYIRDLFQFANLARMDFNSAARLFAMPEFSETVAAGNAHSANVARGLKAGCDSKIALEEFLVETHKKLRINFTVECSHTSFSVNKSLPIMESIVLRKNQWGYALLELSSDCNYLRLSRTSISTEEFEGQEAKVDFVIIPDLLSRGEQEATITIAAPWQTLQLRIKVNYVPDSKSKSRARDKNIKKMLCSLTEEYVAYKTQRSSDVIYEGNIMSNLQKLSVMVDEELREYDFLSRGRRQRADRLAKLIPAYKEFLGILLGKKKIGPSYLKPQSILNGRHGLIKCMSLYIDIHQANDYDVMENCFREMEKEYERCRHQRERYLILWLILNCDLRYDDNKSLRIDMIREDYEKGGTSPIMYLEALSVFNAEPQCLYELGAFECQVIYYGTKKGIVDRALSDEFAMLAGKGRWKHPLIIPILKSLYVRYGGNELLEALCRNMIASDSGRLSEHSYIESAIEAGMRIPKLQDYYLKTLDERSSKPVGMEVLKYFSFSRNIPKEKEAFIYANVVNQREKDPSVFRAYLPRMEKYMRARFAERYIDDKTGVMYRGILKPEMLSREDAKILPDIMFKHKITCTSKNIVSVSVRHKEVSDEVITPFENNIAYVDIYTENAGIFLLDEEGNRFCSTVEYTCEKLFDTEKYLTLCTDSGVNDIRFLLYLHEKIMQYHQNADNIVELNKSLIYRDGLNDVFRNSCIMMLVHNYYDDYDPEELERYLAIADVSYCSSSERLKLTEMFLIREMDKEVGNAIIKYGYEKLNNKLLFRFCKRVIKYAKRAENEEPEENTDDTTEKKNLPERNEELEEIYERFYSAVDFPDMCFHVFEAGKYDSILLRYLTEIYTGTTLHMLYLWKSCKEEGIEVLSLEERLLGQMLFSESYFSDSLSVFYSYQKHYKNFELIKAFLTYTSYKYISKDRLTDNDLFTILYNEFVAFVDIKHLNYRALSKSRIIAAIALLKYYSYQKELTPDKKDFAERFIKEFVKNKIILPFYKEFEGKIELPVTVSDKYYIEYHADPRSRVTIKYMIAGESPEIFSTPMEQVFDGIFVKDIVLFYSDVLQYCIIEENGGEAMITESHQVRYMDCGVYDESSNYASINEVMLAKELHDEETTMELIRQYQREKYLMNTYFTISGE